MSDNFFVITLPLQTEIYQEHILEKGFSICERIYNQFLRKMYSRYYEITKTKKYREQTEAIKQCYRSLEDKTISKEEAKENLAKI